MATRSHRSPARATARQKAAQMLEKPLIMGSIVTSERTCGHKGCRCASGQKHVNSYLAVRRDDRREMICMPAELLSYVRECVQNHRSLQKALETISKDCLQHVLRAKKGHNLF